MKAMKEFARMALKDKEKWKAAASKRSDPSGGAGQEAQALSWMRVEDMRPTQNAVGFEEVGLKMKELRARAADPERLAKYLRGHPIPAVRGPDERMYLIDHHHMGLALTRLAQEWDDSGHGAGLNPYRSCCFEVVKDYADKPSWSLAEFFNKLEEKGWLHPFDGQGRRRPAPPSSLSGLEDDPWRSLAGLVRKAGGFEKVKRPYIEFEWADYFRGKVEASAIRGERLASAVQEGLRLARSTEARGLPGFKGDREGEPLPSIEQLQSWLAKKFGAAEGEPNPVSESIEAAIPGKIADRRADQAKRIGKEIAKTKRP